MQKTKVKIVSDSLILLFVYLVYVLYSLQSNLKNVFSTSTIFVPSPSSRWYIAKSVTTPSSFTGEKSILVALIGSATFSGEIGSSGGKAV